MPDNLLKEAWKNKDESQLCTLFHQSPQNFLSYPVHAHYDVLEVAIRLGLNQISTVIIEDQQYSSESLNSILLFSYQHRNYVVVEKLLTKVKEIQGIPDNIIKLMIKNHEYDDEILTNKLLDLEIVEEVIEENSHYVNNNGNPIQKQFWQNFLITARTLSLNRKLTTKSTSIKKTKI